MKNFLTAKWGITILAITLILLVIVFTQLNVFTFTEGVTTTSLSPVQSFFSESSSKIKNFFRYFGDIEKLKKENSDLNNEIANLKAENLELINDLESSEIILSELEYISEYEYNGVISKIISHGSDNYLQSVIINKGARDGLSVGYPVTTENGYIVGKIVEVNSFTSKVLLLNDIHSKISGIITNDQRSPGIVNGEFGLSLKLTLIPYDHEISVGDMVVTSGLEKNIPGNLIVGEIIGITKNEGELFQTADINQVINYENLSILTVILPTND